MLRRNNQKKREEILFYRLTDTQGELHSDYVLNVYGLIDVHDCLLFYLWWWYGQQILLAAHIPFFFF